MSILRNITHEKHQQVEQLPFVQYLLKGNITTPDYIVYLAEMLAIYQQLESLAADIGLFDGLEGLPRTANMQADLYGGKLIARAVPGSGLWYQFDNRSELSQAFNQRITIELADEALTAFGHYGNIFTDLWVRVNTA